MRLVIQRVLNAGVSVGGSETAAIGKGLLVLVAFEVADGEADLDWVAQKLVKLRIFPDERGVMNRNLLEAAGQLLVVSQFTLFASIRKGNRPSWSGAAPGGLSEPLFRAFVDRVSALLGREVATGCFGADMQVRLVNDGPVTLVVDSRAPE